MDSRRSHPAPHPIQTPNPPHPSSQVIIATAFRRCRRPQRPATVVQLAPQQAPPGGYYAGPPAGYPAQGPAGYPPSQQYGQQPGYAGAWGAAPAAGGYGAAGYGAGGYGQPPAATQPPHFPPPMTTVVLGGPDEEGGAAQPRPQQAPAGGDSASKV